jgi:uncharacterized coiled-coil protein SlyX
MDAPFDRGEIDRASLDATERLRARLSSPPPAPTRPPRQGMFAWALAAGLFVFAAGLLANPWFETAILSRLPFAATVAQPAAGLRAAPALEARLAQLERQLADADAAPTSRMPVERLARTEAKIETSTDQIARESDRIDRLSGQVAGLAGRFDADRARAEIAINAALTAANRAEAMLTLLLVRRAVESGRPLGTLDPALRRGFEARYPGAVKAVATLGMSPVSVATLQRDFNRLRPLIGVQATPMAQAIRQSWWQILADSLSSAVSKPLASGAMRPADRAAQALARGDPISASAAIRQLPTPRQAAVSAWLDAFERWRSGMQGLATLEAASLLGPTAPVGGLAPTAPAVVGE